LVALGSCLTASAFGLIILPLEFAAGGVTGFSVLLGKIIPLPVSAIVLVVNLTLFVLGWFLVGKGFVLKTIYGMIVILVSCLIIHRMVRRKKAAACNGDP